MPVIQPCALCDPAGDPRVDKTMAWIMGACLALLAVEEHGPKRGIQSLAAILCPEHRAMLCELLCHEKRGARAWQRITNGGSA